MAKKPPKPTTTAGVLFEMNIECPACLQVSDYQAELKEYLISFLDFHVANINHQLTCKNKACKQKFIVTDIY